MIIKLSPSRQDGTLTLAKRGDTLTVNAEDFDFSPLGLGDTLPSGAINSPWFTDQVDRDDLGELTITLILPNPWNYSPEQAFPLPLTDVPDGLVIFPAPLPVNETESSAEVAQ